MNLRTTLSRTVEVKAYQWVMIWTALTVLWAGGIYGVYVYVGDQADGSRRQSEQASYENARDERTRCEQRVEGREASRVRAFTNIEYVAGVVALIDGYITIPDELHRELLDLEAEERARVDEQLPALSIDDCPPIPTPPGG